MDSRVHIRPRMVLCFDIATQVTATLADEALLVIVELGTFGCIGLVPVQYFD